ncbi:hypothetical protein EVAR_74444_1 [Eumeta japonica]|uniref:Uncharacterized protein n=1 Tax=Eumeta variegata TaxID=151549 RepID=A0A4C1YPV3_EUMVA|nr:hypothetical protein EVAR_74444_1 [Eumeta japonica]
MQFFIIYMERSYSQSQSRSAVDSGSGAVPNFDYSYALDSKPDPTLNLDFGSIFNFGPVLAFDYVLRSALDSQLYQLIGYGYDLYETGAKVITK